MKLKLNWESALLALLVVEILLFGALNPRMLDLNMLLFSTSDFICIGIVALPLTLVIISGGIDISLGSTIGLCAIALGVMTQAGWPLWLAVSLTLLLGLLCGLFNAAILHERQRIPRTVILYFQDQRIILQRYLNRDCFFCKSRCISNQIFRYGKK